MSAKTAAEITGQLRDFVGPAVRLRTRTTPGGYVTAMPRTPGRHLDNESGRAMLERRVRALGLGGAVVTFEHHARGARMVVRVPPQSP